jgi:predicted anti-sigma-YlaC factor YlaD
VSIEDIVIDSAADLLSADAGGVNAFTMDDDPQLIADALPLTLKIYEMILSSRPEHPELQYATGKNFIMYSNAFIQTPAGMLQDDKYLEEEQMTTRAKKMYIRGRDYVINALDIHYPGFKEALSAGGLDKALSAVNRKEDAALLYWAASGWIGAYSCDPFDFDMASRLYVPTAMLIRALQLDSEFNRGAIHDIFIQIYSSLPSSHLVKALAEAPETLGSFYNDYYAAREVSEKPEDRAAFHFKEAIRLSEGLNPGTYCTWASAVSVKKQDYQEYKALLEKALEINPKSHPENELAITIFQEKAAWMLDNAENFFILDLKDYQ